MALGQLGGEHFDDDFPSKRGIFGDEHARHPAAAELPLDDIGVAECVLELVLDVGSAHASLIFCSPRRRARALRPAIRTRRPVPPRLPLAAT
jgi:hypothetical protein